MQRIFFLIVLLFNGGIGVRADTVMEIITLKNRPAESIQAVVEPLLENNEQIIATSDSLILKVRPENLSPLSSLIKKLDKPLSQFIIYVTQSRAQSSEQLTASLHGMLSTHSRYLRGKYGDTQTLNQQNSIQTLRTLEGKPAFIKSGENRPFYPIRLWRYPGSQTQPTYDVDTQWMEITTGFAVTPYLSGDKIQLTISPWSDRFEINQTISVQEAATTLIVSPGEWTAIGEISSAHKTQQDGFLRHSRNTAQNQLKIFVKVEKLP